MDPSLQTEAVIGAGRGALIGSMFGAGWLGWGLGEAKVFDGIVGPAFGLMALFLWACSINTIRKGRLLRKKYPPVSASARQAVRRSFLLVVLMEVLTVVFVWILANRIRRPDLGADWCAMVVGLHVLPLARTFRAPTLGVFGVLITLWCVLCWALFRSNVLTTSAALGTGILLWATSVSALFAPANSRTPCHNLGPPIPEPSPDSSNVKDGRWRVWSGQPVTQA